MEGRAMTMARILRANGAVEETAPKNGRDFSLEELKNIVGGYIEIVPLESGEIMIVNEEGKLYHLPVNMQATHLYGYEIIVGDVLVCDKGQVR